MHKTNQASNERFGYTTGGGPDRDTMTDREKVATRLGIPVSAVQIAADADAGVYPNVAAADWLDADGDDDHAEVTTMIPLPPQMATFQPVQPQRRKGTVYRARHSVNQPVRERKPWWRRKILGIPFALPILFVLIPAIAFAAVIAFNKTISGSVKGASVGADGGWGWVPVTQRWAVDGTYLGTTTQNNALAAELDIDPGDLDSGQPVRIPDNGGCVAAVRIADRGSFAVKLIRAMPGGECRINVGLQSETNPANVAKVEVGTPTVNAGAVSVVSVALDPSAPAKANLFNGVTGGEQYNTVKAGDVLDGANVTRVLPLKLTIPAGADLGTSGEWNAFTVTVPLELVGTNQS
ncbi:hypothetical protein [Asanoa iriomotensis]|uniref:Uncharacterized protein n=1 Tax=Asanoa iriomotensis TaxID=234613 RepID=A0ABQ4CBT8_9ACTN|nr:hypothetical protein [Asanoa iriomotensis]GIF60229.1 hypothetical protein Air01nite_63240 [Asanoa iriomotensis]